MTKPKTSVKASTQTKSSSPPVAPRAKAPEPEEISSSAIDTQLVIAPPANFYAVLDNDEFDPPFELAPVVMLLHRSGDQDTDEAIGYVPVDDRIRPVTSLDTFVQYWSGDPEDFNPVELGLIDADDEDADDDDDDDDNVEDVDDDSDDADDSDDSDDADDDDDEVDGFVDDEEDKGKKKTADDDDL